MTFYCPKRDQNSFPTRRSSDLSRRNEETGVWEKGKYEKWMLVKSHICRRTFATINYDKLSNKAIMAVTGHSTERMLMNYVGATETDHFDVVYNAWNQHKTNK